MSYITVKLINLPASYVLCYVLHHTKLYFPILEYGFFLKWTISSEERVGFLFGHCPLSPCHYLTSLELWYYLSPLKPKWFFSWLISSDLLLSIFFELYFISSHFISFYGRYDGIQLWDLRLEPGMHDFVWWSSLVSFLFLYPSTFNLLEVSDW